MTEPLTDERLAEIQERCDLATPGPWEASFKEDVEDYSPATVERVANKVTVGDCWDSEICLMDYSSYGTDTQFIAHARQDIPDLLAEIERLRGLLRRVTIRTLSGPEDPSFGDSLWEEVAKADNHLRG